MTIAPLNSLCVRDMRGKNIVRETAKKPRPSPFEYTEGAISWDTPADKPKTTKGGAKKGSKKGSKKSDTKK